MIRKLSAAPLTYINTDPLDWVRACHAARLDYLGIRLYRVGQEYEIPLDIEAPLFREMKSLIADSGLEVLDIEVFSLTEQSTREIWLPLLKAGQALGARYLNVVGDDPNLTRFEEKLGQLTHDAKAHGIMPLIETIAYRPMNNYARAIQIAHNVGCQLEFDGLHFVRTGAQLSDITRHTDLFPIAQFCDAKLAIPVFDEQQRRELGAGLQESDEVVESRYLRTLPGEGDAPWAEVMHALPETTVVALETPNAILAQTMSASEYLVDQAKFAREFLLDL